MSRHADWLRRADAEILHHLEREQPTYVPLVASRLGLDLDYAEQRCSKLAAEDLIEPVSHEVIYRITDRGQRQLSAYADAEGVPRPRHATAEPTP